MSAVLVEPYVRKHLSAADVAALYQQALAQTEQAVCNAWVNLVLLPGDETRQHLYARARGQLAALEADLARVQKGNEPCPA